MSGDIITENRLPYNKDGCIRYMYNELKKYTDKALTNEELIVELSPMNGAFNTAGHVIADHISFIEHRPIGDMKEFFSGYQRVSLNTIIINTNDEPADEGYELYHFLNRILNDWFSDIDWTDQELIEEFLPILLFLMFPDDWQADVFVNCDYIPVRHLSIT